MSQTRPLFYLYLTLAILGLLGTWYYNFQYFAASDSIHFGPYLETLLVNHATTAVTIDIYCAALVFSVWAWVESKRTGMKWPFVYIFLCFGIGIAFAYPLFLAFREKQCVKTLSDTK